MRDYREGQVKSALIVDCGSTTRAIMIEQGDDGYHLVAFGEAPSTVESPYFDVTLGVLNAIRSIEQTLDRRLIIKEENRISIAPRKDSSTGTDLFLATSSNAGGLQMLAVGLVKIMTADSAKRAALGAGSVVMDVMAIDDDRLPHEKIQRIRHLRPDMIILSGGVDGGNEDKVEELAQLIAAAKLSPLPIVFAGNRAARDRVRAILGSKYDLRMVENVRPVLETETLDSARSEISNLFMENAVSHAPGYSRLAEWTDGPIIPTPGAIGSIVETYAKQKQVSVIGVSLGDATTDVFSVFEQRFTRSVSGNLGMGSSIGNVMVEAGVPTIRRWLPFEMGSGELRNRVRNKMLRPAMVPDTTEDLIIEHAIAREAIRLAFDQHRASATGLRGVRQIRDISNTFDQKGTGETLVDMMKLDLIIGFGAVLAQAPRPVQSLLALVDALQPQGITRVALDTQHIAPHLGALSTVYPSAAHQVFERDCLATLGTVIAPVGQGRSGDECVTVEAVLPSGEHLTKVIKSGAIDLMPLPQGLSVLTVKPAKGFDLGKGSGQTVTIKAGASLCGVLIDTRGCSLPVHRDEHARVSQLRKWYQALDVYPLS